MVQVLCFSHLAVFVCRHWGVGTACHEIGCKKMPCFPSGKPNSSMHASCMFQLFQFTKDYWKEF